MKRLAIAALLFITSPLFAQARLGDVPPPTGRYTNYIDTVPLGKATREKLNNFYLSVAAAWEDGSEYRPIIFLHLELPKGANDSSAINPEALIEAAALAKEPVRFYLHAKSPGENPQEFKVREISWRGTTIHLKTGSIETKGPPKQKVAQVSAPIDAPIEVRGAEASEVPELLTDYTVQGNIRLGVREETDYITIFCASPGYTVVQARKVGARTIKLSVDNPNENPKLPYRDILLTFDHEVNPKRIWMTPIRGDTTFVAAINKLRRDVRDGDIRAPMFRELASARK
ncbi:MAG: hypothetical protein Q7R93_01645 [bacterium]|nr:hypothetical protein [bacterium]